MKFRFSSFVFLCVLNTPTFAAHVINHYASAGAMSAFPATPAKLYVGIFGGGNSSNNFNVSQYGTAFPLEAAGGPLAVNAFGVLHSETASYIGMQVGYQLPGRLLNPATGCTLAPAAELEAFSMSNTSFNGTVVNNTTRYPNHNFSVTYPMSRSVFLVNGVVNFTSPWLMVNPYLGLGIGGAVVRISGADATQLAPAEAGVNHYNSDSNASDTTLASQIKLGLSYDINQYATLFAEYRWLYLASTRFEFGSTVYASHVVTTSWRVNMDAQRYNSGDIGVRVNL